MGTTQQHKGENRPCGAAKQIVVVFDADACITDILREIVLPRRTNTDLASAISAVGFVDGSQIREIVRIIDREKTLAQ